MNKRTADKLIRLGWDNAEVERFMTLKSHRKGRFKIVITGDRKDFDDLSELANHPERGVYVDTQFFNYPDEAEAICDIYEGYFYLLYDKDTLIDSGVVSVDFIYDAVQNTANYECGGVCELFFFRRLSHFKGIPGYYCGKKVS